MAWRRRPDSQPAVHTVQQKGKVFRKLIRFGDSPLSQHSARLAAIRRVQADGARTANTLSSLAGYHGTSQRHLPFLHHIALQSIVSGDTFFLYRFTTNTRLSLYPKISDRQTTQQQSYQPYTKKPSAHCPLLGSVTISVYLPTRCHLHLVCFLISATKLQHFSILPAHSSQKIVMGSKKRRRAFVTLRLVIQSLESWGLACFLICICLQTLRA